MLIFLYGSDAYRLRQAKRDIIGEYKKKHSSGVNIFSFDLSDGDNLSKLADAAKSLSFFNEHKLIVLGGVFSKKSTSDEMAGIIKNEGLDLAKDITLLFAEPYSEAELAKNKDLFKILTSNSSMVKVFNPLERAKLIQWVEGEFKIRGCSINRDALDKLVNTVGNDSWALINEVEKIAAYADNHTVSVDDIELLVSPKIESDVFVLLDLVNAGKGKEAAAFLYKELKSDKDLYQILGAIVYQIRSMLIIKDLTGRKLSVQEISQKAGFHPFVVRKITGQVTKIETSRLRSLYKDLLSLDLTAKSGGSDLVSGLNKFVLSI